MSDKAAPRGPKLVGGVGDSYALAANLWRAAHDHKQRGCADGCDVSLVQIELAANRVMRHRATIREDRDFMKWEWPF